MSELRRLAITSSQICETWINLRAEQQHYLIRVLRLGKGDRFLAIDGEGQAWLVELVEGSNGKDYGGQICRQIESISPFSLEITLLAALPKNGFDDVVRQVTELGVSRIIPVISERTVLKPSPQKVERWRRIALESAEQSERFIIPTITNPVAFASGFSSASSGVGYICEGRGNFPHLLTALNSLPTQEKPPKIVIGIGPEGGWTERELEMAIDLGFQGVSLGSLILRAITAPLVALALIQGYGETNWAKNC